MPDRQPWRETVASGVGKKRLERNVNCMSCAAAWLSFASVYLRNYPERAEGCKRFCRSYLCKNTHELVIIGFIASICAIKYKILLMESTSESY